MTNKRATKRPAQLPKHIAIVPDGNGRWAEQQGLPRFYGHQAGLKSMYRLLDYLKEYPIKYITFYGFSTENWARPEDEVEGIFRMVEEFIDEYLQEIHARGIKLRHLGRLHELPKALQQAIKKALALTENNSGVVLSIAFNYGGRAEILDAVGRLISEGVPAQQIDEELFGHYLDTSGLPDVDLLIRTGDERRLSNFLIWQTAYSEYHFSKVLWPDFGKKDLERALHAYSQRQRRFGGLAIG